MLVHIAIQFVLGGCSCDGRSGGLDAGLRPDAAGSSVAEGAGDAADGGGGDGSASDAGPEATAAMRCGNSIVEPDEECDDGNAAVADGCQNDCTLTCESDADCDDADPCTGVEACSNRHRCERGMAPNEGSACGSDAYCVSGACLPASCGDGQAQPGEECDDGNVTEDDGCGNQCEFVCVSTDPSRNCAAVDECLGAARCDDDTHVCVTGDPPAEGTACSLGTGYCSAGSCRQPLCGDAVTEPGEDCDDGDTDDADGCTQQCAFTCVTAATCDDSNPCTTNTCDSGMHICSNAADPAQNGQPCSIGALSGTCSDGDCVAAGCGDGDADAGEECDLGASNGPGSGCTRSCQFECASAADCDDDNPCNGDESCAPTAGGQRCEPGAPLSEHAVCRVDPRRICSAQQECALSFCGDGYADSVAGEECDPPNTETCDASCHELVCGNGDIDGEEQCDDGNVEKHDGCDSDCRYEPVYRVFELSLMQGQSPPFCTPRTNQFANAFTPAAWAVVNQALQESIDHGTTNILFQMFDADDLTGVADDYFEVGYMSGFPDPARGTWPVDGSNPIDWWFLLDPATVDAEGMPISRHKNGALAARALTLGPSDVAYPFQLGGVTAMLEMLQMRTRGRTDGVPPPDVPAPPPEQLRDGLTVCQSTSVNLVDDGVCGNLTVASLSTMKAAPDFTQGASRCLECPPFSRSYTYCGTNPVGPGCNSMLDVLVGGCAVGTNCLLALPVVIPTQPDVNNGGASNLQNDPANTNKVPAAWTVGNRNAYSSYFRYRSKRAHITGLR